MILYNVISWLVVLYYAVYAICDPDVGNVHLNRISFKNQSNAGIRRNKIAMAAKMDSSDMIQSVKKKLKNIVKGLDHRSSSILSLLLEGEFTSSLSTNTQLPMVTTGIIAVVDVETTKTLPVLSTLSSVETVFVTKTITKVAVTLSSTEKPSHSGSLTTSTIPMSASISSTTESSQITAEGENMVMMKSYLSMLEHKVNSLHAKLEDINDKKLQLPKEITKTEYLLPLSSLSPSFLTSQPSVISSETILKTPISNPPDESIYQEHGQGAKDIVNMKPLPYKISVKPQFQSHQSTPKKSGIYAKPKIVYNLGPEPQTRRNLAVNDSPFQESKSSYPLNQMNHSEDPENDDRIKQLLKKPENENLVDYIRRLVPELEMILSQKTQYQPQDLPENGIENSSPNGAIESSNSDNEKTDESAPEPSNISSPFKTFRNKAEVNENYHRFQINKTDSKATTVKFPPIMEELPQENRRFKHQFRDRKSHKKSRNHTGYNFNIFGFRSSGNRPRATWILPAIIALAM